MSTIGPALPPASLVPTYSPLGRPAVGLESPEAKNQTLPPVEESSRSDKNRNPPEGDLTTDAERRRGRGRDAPAGELSDEELQDVRELAAIDREVRAHEAAHAAVGGGLAGSPSFRFVTGPDGEQYAVSGEVPISLEVVPQDPAATLRNAEQVQAAALAPALPSSQDLAVAAAAAQLILESQLQLAAQRAATSAAEQPGPDAARTAGEARVTDTAQAADTIQASDTIQAADAIRAADTNRAADSIRAADAARPASVDAANAFKSAATDTRPGSLLDQLI